MYRRDEIMTLDVNMYQIKTFIRFNCVDKKKVGNIAKIINV